MREVRALRATGRSMEPHIYSGDVLLYNVSPSRLEVGDVIVAAAFAHRILWIDPAGGIWECGDAPNAVPTRRRHQDIDGRAIGLFRGRTWIQLNPIRRPKFDLIRVLGRWFVGRMARVGSFRVR